MDTLIKGHIHDKLKRGIWYNTSPPPYNNNYIPPTTDLLEKNVDVEMPLGDSKVDPLNKVTVEDDEFEVNETKKQENIPLENQIITNENGGKKFVESKKIEPRKEKKVETPTERVEAPRK